MSLSGEFHSFIIRSNQPFVNIIKETLIAWKCQNFVFCYAFWTILRIFFWQPRNYLRYFRSKIRKTDFYIRQKRKYSRHSLWLRLQTKGARNTRNKKCTKAESLLLAAFFFAGGKCKERSSGCALQVCAKKKQTTSRVRRMGYFSPVANGGLKSCLGLCRLAVSRLCLENPRFFEESSMRKRMDKACLPVRQAVLHSRPHRPSPAGKNRRDGWGGRLWLLTLEKRSTIRSRFISIRQF